MVPSCPDAASLQRLLDGTLAETVQADLSQHLENCASCRAALDNLATDGRSLLGLARDLQQNPTPAEPGLQRVLNEATGADPGDTQTDPRSGKNEELAFLAPSAKPGSLGRLGHYEVLEVLGQGGFGLVVKAFDEMLHRVVAIKIMFLQLAATSPARKRFLREARASAAIRHENVVAIHAVEDQPLPHLVMEYIPGQTLQHKLDQTGPLDVVEVLRLGCQIANGLAAAHGMGLIHRDIKPSNILLESGVEPQVKITDFGLARAADDASLTQSGVIAGTPMYMAPEQAQGEHIDHRADLFSLGSVLYVMCSGRPPFRATTTLGVLKRVAEDTPRPIRAIIPEVPEWLCAIVAKLHAKKPGDRFQTAKEVADVLAKYLAELRAHGRVLPLDPEPAAGARPVPVPLKQDSPRLLKRRWAIGAGVLALLSLTIGMILYLNRNTGRPPPLAIAPFDAAKAKEHQEAWAKHLGVDVEISNSIGMKLALIPPGQFLMGSPDDEPGRQGNEGPQHTVGLTQPFYLGVHDVTVGQFKAFVKEQGYQTEAENGEGGERFVLPEGKWKKDRQTNWQTPGVEQTDDHPVVCVDWNDAKAFCDWLSHKEGKHYALPTEAQWEYACRAGSRTTFSFGDDQQDVASYAWYNANSGWKPHPVGQKKPNAWGLFDMNGNVWQWVADWYGNNYYQESPKDDPAGPGAGDKRVLRGGAWPHTTADCRAARRDGDIRAPSYASTFIGFRVALVGDLPLKPTGGQWVQLFNGKDLSGWKTSPAFLGDWSIADGALVGKVNDGGLGLLFSERGDYENFHLRAVVKLRTGNSGISFRNAADSENGYHTEIIDRAGSSKTGSVLVHTDSWKELFAAQGTPSPEEDWVTLEIVAKGAKLTTIVNGKIVAQVSDTTYRRGHIALEVSGSKQGGGSLKEGTVVLFRKIEIKELSPTKTTDIAPPFFILAKGARAERTFFTLAEAVAAAQAGDTIEIRGNGPFVESGRIVINKALLIRAGDKYRPVITFQHQPLEEDWPGMIDARAPLGLEGVEVQYTKPVKFGSWGLLTTNSPLRMLNCRLVVQGACAGIRLDDCPGEIRRCEILTDTWGSIAIFCGQHPAKLVVDESVLACPDGTVYIHTPNSSTGKIDMDLRITRSTVAGGFTNLCSVVDRTLPVLEREAQPLRLECSGNVFSLSGDKQRLLSLQCRVKGENQDTETALLFLKKWMSWSEGQNLYPDRPLLGLMDIKEQLFPGGHLYRAQDEWRKFWAIPESKSLQGTARFHGGDILARLQTAPLQLNTQDFSLVKGSPGQGVLPGGKDLGADVDLVGPGAPYEKWKQTEGYQQWLKDSGQVKAEPPAGDLEKLQGIWVITSFAVGGSAVPGPVGDTFTIDGDKFTLAPKTELMKGTVKIDPTQKPKALDLDVTEGGKKGIALCIYALEADELKLSFAEPGVKDRPTELGSKKGTTHIFVTLKRKKD